jgi:hypothetical protein
MLWATRLEFEADVFHRFFFYSASIVERIEFIYSKII